MLLTWTAVLVALGTWSGRCVARRGPHHPRGQIPTDEQHHHYLPHGDSKLTHDTNLIHDRRHLEEDLGHLASKDMAEMSDEELDFYYFTLHDFDRNSLLDGLEILKAVLHTADHDDNHIAGVAVHDKEDNSIHNDEPVDLDNIIELVDQLLLEDDSNNDGYISYSEFKLSMKSGRGIKNKRSNITRSLA